MANEQNFSNHTRYEPGFHFILIPILLINVLLTIVVFVHHWPYQRVLHGWLVVMAIALLMLAGLAREYANKVQDRVIRLEESLRYQRLLTPDVALAAQALSVRQVIALRFASDAELQGLVQRTLAENLTPKQIKQAVQVWRPDTHRV